MIAHFYINRVYLSNLYRLLDEDGGWETVEPHLSFGEEGGGDKDEHVESQTKVILLQTAFILAERLML